MFLENTGKRCYNPSIMSHLLSKTLLWHHPFCCNLEWDPRMPVIPCSPYASPPTSSEEDSLPQQVLDPHKSPKSKSGYRTDLASHSCGILPMFTEMTVLTVDQIKNLLPKKFVVVLVQRLNQLVWSKNDPWWRPNFLYPRQN